MIQCATCQFVAVYWLNGESYCHFCAREIVLRLALEGKKIVISKIKRLAGKPASKV